MTKAQRVALIREAFRSKVGKLAYQPPKTPTKRKPAPAKMNYYPTMGASDSRLVVTPQLAQRPDAPQAHEMGERNRQPEVSAVTKVATEIFKWQRLSW